MTGSSRIVLSASRRTDIPAFFMPWFMERITAGSFTVTNPYNGRSRVVKATPERVHTIVFWSKDFGPMLSNSWDLKLRQMGYGLFFQFTINSANSILEPNVPPLEKRLEQLKRLCRRHAPRRVQWRFDPVCHWYDRDGRTGNNLEDLETIADAAASCGLSSCVTSFVDLYRKVVRRASASPLTFFEPDPATRVEVIRSMEKILARRKISLATCCEKELLEILPPTIKIRAAGCIDGRRLTELNGPGISLRRDPGQRKSSGCNCTVAVDIGDYRLHRCRHNCLFCYASPLEPFGGKTR